jgi:hypothetical protein
MNYSLGHSFLGFVAALAVQFAWKLSMDLRLGLIVGFGTFIIRIFIIPIPCKSIRFPAGCQLSLPLAFGTRPIPVHFLDWIWRTAIKFYR